MFGTCCVWSMSQSSCCCKSRKKDLTMILLLLLFAQPMYDVIDGK